MREGRIFEKQVEEKWIETKCKDIKKDDVFRIFDDDEPVVFKECTKFKADSDAVNTIGQWTVECSPIK